MTRQPLELHYVDPRLVALYDTDNPRGADTDFYLSLAAELEAQRIIDLGCGTGQVTVELATEGRQVTGIDPAPQMLNVARHRTGGERVTWVEGDASSLGTHVADLVIMTGNVAQIFLEDAEWASTLRAIHAALRPGGYIAFESRTPDARAWEHWVRAATYEQIDSPYGPMECWLELKGVEGDLVHFEGHNVFLETGEVLVAPSTLRFRTQAELAVSLAGAGFVVQHIYGDWRRGALTRTSPIMVFVAQRA